MAISVKLSCMVTHTVKGKPMWLESMPASKNKRDCALPQLRIQKDLRVFVEGTVRQATRESL